MSFIIYRTTTTSGRSGGLLPTLVRLAVMAVLGAALVALALVGFLVVLPLILLAGIVSYFYVRRRFRRAPQRSREDAIDAEYTIIEK